MTSRALAARNLRFGPAAHGGVRACVRALPLMLLPLMAAAADGGAVLVAAFGALNQ
jgi:hypothetical protein